ncbi:MAG TPA: hypothetical protein VJ742_10950, partial [Nitrososphaera sp.]|nr:hypothetical protein [Nitrososphaera sp.]
MAGIVAIYSHTAGAKNNVIYYLTHSMRMLQHRGKAYWKMIVGNGAAGAEGWLPSDEAVLRVAQKEKLHGNNGIGYLSKRPPPFPSMNNIWVAFDGFFVDTEKLHLHPYIGSAKDSDSLFKIYHIFTQLLFEKKDPERAAEFLERHLRGNLLIKVGDEIIAYRDGTGFKPLVSATNRDHTLQILASENSLRSSLIDMEFRDVKPGQLLRMSKKNGGIEVLAETSAPRIMMDPFEFIRESNVVATVNGKSIYQIRKNIGREQAKLVEADLDVDS